MDNNYMKVAKVSSCKRLAVAAHCMPAGRRDPVQIDLTPHLHLHAARSPSLGFWCISSPI
uniref:Uncharacterized protein n=1 Tax=Oryza glumipatula TaxID=40148 RepID=A0A0D9ZAE1_9ORYZ